MAKKQTPVDETQEQNQEPTETSSEETINIPPAQTIEEEEEIDFDALREEMRQEYEEKLRFQQEEMAKKVSEVFGLNDTSGDDEKPIYTDGENITEYLDKYDSWKHRQEEKRADEQRELEEKNAEQVKQQQTEYIESVKLGWANQIKELEEEGNITKAKDENNPNDPGVKEREALFAKMNEVNFDRQQKGLSQTWNLHEVFHRFYKGGEVAGGDIQVLGGSPKASTGNKPDYYYEDIHGKSAIELSQSQ